MAFIDTVLINELIPCPFWENDNHLASEGLLCLARFKILMIVTQINTVFYLYMDTQKISDE